MPQQRWHVEQIPTAERQRREEVSAFWRPYSHTKRFLQEHFPGKWEAIKWCCRTPAYAQDVNAPDFVKRKSTHCHKLPFCLWCVRADNVRRAMKHFDKFSKVTPKGKAPRFYHMVQTAPYGRPGQYAGGGDWGRQASEDVPAFAKMVWEAVGEEFDGEVGAVMSYHDIGEEGFTKRHPHMDFTLNGWMLKDARPAKVPPLEMRAGGRERWDAKIQAKAQRFTIGAQRGMFDTLGPRSGIREYYGILKYQMREIVDLRKIHYPRGSDHVWWKNKDGVKMAKMPVGEFKAALHEYEARLGSWRTGVGRTHLHRRYGLMADKVINKSMDRMGGQPLKHRSNCVCPECGDWQDYELSADEIRRINPRPLKGARF